MTKNIICLGLNKTGTTSLKKACARLGWNVQHSSNPFTFIKRITKSRKKLLDAYTTPAFFADLFPPSNTKGIDNYFLTQEWRNHIMKKLYKEYSDSFFIFTIRDINSWLESRAKHIRRNQKNEKYLQKNQKWDEIDKEAWTMEYYLHFDSTLSIFSDQILIMNIVGGDGYEKLCPFLRVEIIKESFPLVNKAKN